MAKQRILRYYYSDLMMTKANLVLSFSITIVMGRYYYHRRGWIIDIFDIVFIHSQNSQTRV